MISAQKFALYSKDPKAFRKDLVVDVDGLAKAFGKVQDPWQRDDFAALDPAWLYCAGCAKKSGKMRAYLERGRGHSKTTDLAVMACWALAFATRLIKGAAFAADKDQARLLRDAMLRLTRLNPWLGQILSVEAHRVVNVADGHPGNGSTLDISASDVGSSYGLLLDFVIADELCHWEENAQDLWSSIISTAAKRATCVMVVISNAGFVDSWQWQVREAVRDDANWYFSRLEGPQASWLNDERLEEQRRLLPPVAYERLWGNQWSTGGGDALTREIVEAAFKPELQPLPPRVEGWSFVAGLDLGVSRDCSAICVLAVRKANSWEHDRADHGRIRLAYTKLWRPITGRKINLQEVENELRGLNHGYDFETVNVDPWQATHMSQRLALSGLRMEEVPPTGNNLQRIATTLIESFNDRRVDLFVDEDLKRDILRMRVEERSYGFRLVSPRDSHGHGDLGTAFSLALLAASELAGRKIVLCGPMVDPLLTEEQEQELDPEYQFVREAWCRMIARQSNTY